jgi:hypothetical protein
MILSDKLDRAAMHLAAGVNHGLHSSTSEEAKFDLRALSLELAGWADEARDLIEPRGQIVEGPWPARPGIRTHVGESA